MFLPCLFIFFISLMGIGIIGNSAEFRQGPSAIVPFWVTAFGVYKQILAGISQVPGVCWAGNTVNDYQAQQCSNFWQSLSKTSGLALVPFLAVGVYIYLGLGNLTALYKKGQKSAAKGNAAFGGTVTHPAEGPPDLFSWYYCLRPIMVQLADKSQMKLYMPIHAPVPRPGETLAAFADIKAFGNKRHLAIGYTPHVAVVRGG